MTQVKNYIFAFILSIIALPLLQYWFAFAKPKALEGDSPKANIEFYPPKWDSGEFQEVKEAYLTHNFGFRPWFVRLHNEFEFRIFDKMNWLNGRVGKNQVLFEQGYLDEYTGKDFIGETAINDKMDKLAALKDTLSKRNILLLVVFTPSKAHFYAESLPKCNSQKGKDILYDHFTRACQKRNIPYIDFNQYFLSLKGKSPYPLFTKTGIHWSEYGAVLAMDSLFKRIEKEKNMDMPDFDWHEMTITTTPNYWDNDIWRLANLFSKINTDSLAYPKLTYGFKGGQKKVKTLTIGDSFWWSVYNSGANENIFGKGGFWYYFDEISPDKNLPVVDKYNIKSEMEQYEVIIIESTGMNLHDFGFGFIESALERYQHPKSKEEIEKQLAVKVDYYIQKIQNTPEWLNDIKHKAEKEHISLEEMIRKNAVYMAEQDVK